MTCQIYAVQLEFCKFGSLAVEVENGKLKSAPVLFHTQHLEHAVVLLALSGALYMAAHVVSLVLAHCKFNFL